MEIYSNKFTRNILKFSIIGLIFILSCGKVEEQVVEDSDDETVQWYTKLGFKEHMKQIKSDTTLLTRKMGEGDWVEAEELCANIEKSFDALDLSSDEIPEDFFELQGMFKDQLARIAETCREKDFEASISRLRALKQACSHCHRVIRKEFDRMNTATDYDVAVDKIFKDKGPSGN